MGDTRTRAGSAQWDHDRPTNAVTTTTFRETPVTTPPHVVTYNWTGLVGILNSSTNGNNKVLRLKKGEPVTVTSMPFPLTMLPFNQCLTTAAEPLVVGEVQAIRASASVIAPTTEQEWKRPEPLTPLYLYGRGVIHLDPEAEWAQPLLSGGRQRIECHTHIQGVEERDQRWWHRLARFLGLDAPEPLTVYTEWVVHHANLLTESPLVDTTDRSRNPLYIELAGVA
jgi:hypothetical protein